MAETFNSQGIVVATKQQYSCLQRLLCCRCFQSCQQETFITAATRKQIIQRLMSDQLAEDEESVASDPIRLMLLIYVSTEDQIPAKHIQNCKISPSTGVIDYRTDLQFYLPQLCNYIIFHRNLESNYLRQALEKMAKLNFYFAHLYYFHMKSLEQSIASEEVQILRPVVDYNVQFRSDLASHYKENQLTCLDLFIQKSAVLQNNQDDEFTSNMIMEYESKKVEYGKLLKCVKVKVQDIKLKKYVSIFHGEHQTSSSFQSTLQLFQNLFFICNQLGGVVDKKEKAKQLIKMVNEHLPSTAYVPFSKNSYRVCNILKIVTGQTKVLTDRANKEKTSLCICVETYCPAESLSAQDEQKFWTNVQTPITLKMVSFTNRVSFFARNYEQTAEFKKFRQTSFQMRNWGEISNIMVEERVKQERLNEYQQVQLQKKAFSQRQNHTPSFCIEMVQLSKLEEQLLQTSPESNLEKLSSKDSSSSPNKKETLKNCKGYNQNTRKFYIKQFQKMFGQSLKDAKARMSQNSIFAGIGTWDLLCIIIKTHEDLKQEQFAMQLIHQFDYIFKLEKLSLHVTTYQVLPMGPNRGIIEMVRDSVTFDRLHKTLQTSFPNKVDFKSFFQIFYADRVKQAKENFMKSLAAYSLMTYILQVKDRNNSNISLHRNGKIFYSNFGFFLSNKPDAVIQFQRDCPFKLLDQYLQVLEGVGSYYFRKFKEYFFLGFKAIRQHQSKILMLVKMMYSTSGLTMPCFARGQDAIRALEKRINPPGVTNDALLNEHCQGLINQSLNNQGSKWYDRFQYWGQGIYC